MENQSSENKSLEVFLTNLFWHKVHADESKKIELVQLTTYLILHMADHFYPKKDAMPFDPEIVIDKIHGWNAGYNPLFKLCASQIHAQLSNIDDAIEGYIRIFPEKFRAAYSDVIRDMLQKMYPVVSEYCNEVLESKRQFDSAGISNVSSTEPRLTKKSGQGEEYSGRISYKGSLSETDRIIANGVELDALSEKDRNTLFNSMLVASKLKNSYVPPRLEKILKHVVRI